jgi:SAM-dependent methyltransferase
VSVPDLARSFGSAAEAYERGRPGYAEAALDAVGLAPEAVVLDLAAGTGKLTRQLVTRHVRVVAVEPLEEMRAVLERVVPEAEALAGEATAIPLEDDAVEAVFVAEAFHWFASAETLAEIARVLRPGGALAILFNRADPDRAPILPQAARNRIDDVAIRKPAEQTVNTGLWRTPLPGPFGPFADSVFPNPVTRDRERMLAQIASWSVVAALPEAERERLLGDLRELLPEREYVDELRTVLTLGRLGSDR